MDRVECPEWGGIKTSEDCPECGTRNYKILPGYNSYSKIHTRPWSTDKGIVQKPEFCQTCLKLRMEMLDKLFAEADKAK